MTGILRSNWLLFLVEFPACLFNNTLLLSRNPFGNSQPRDGIQIRS